MFWILNDMIKSVVSQNGFHESVRGDVKLCIMPQEDTLSSLLPKSRLIYFHLFRIQSILNTTILPFPKRQILDNSKLRGFADDNFKYDENGRKFSKRVENIVEKKKRNCS